MDDQLLEDPGTRELVKMTMHQNAALKMLHFAVESIACEAFGEGYTGTDAMGQMSGLRQQMNRVQEQLDEVDKVFNA